MAEAGFIEGMNPKDEFHQIIEHINNGDNFLLSGGAGSGKTHSLVQVIRRILIDHPMSKIACITYTNAAANEIKSRVDHQNLQVSTIHDFLWDNIKHFQKELKSTIIELINDADIKKLKIDDMAAIPEDYYENREEPVKIQYREYLRLKDGIISHDELLVVANQMFRKYIKLCDIVKDKYKFILVDEYQDTQKEVIEILLKHFLKSHKKNIIGFFGDAMQSIYDDRICNLNEYTGNEEGSVKEVKKKQNRRNPQKVIDLANKLRTDGIRQEPSNDVLAPNMFNGHVKEGNIKFLYSVIGNIVRVNDYLSVHYGWNFSDTKETKELNLTHNLIADKAGFRTLMDIYGKDYILKYKNQIKNYIKDHGISTDFSAFTFGKVIEKLIKEKADKKINPAPIMKKFIEDNLELYEAALKYNYETFSKIYVDKDQLIDDKKQDDLIKHLMKIQTNIDLYTNEQFNEFLRVTDYNRIKNIEDKKILKNKIESLIVVGNKTIEEVIKDAHEKGICIIDDKLEKFRNDKEYVYNRVKNVEFRELQNLYAYLLEKTPFSTQHKTKGTEYNNVLVILDNGKWPDYNFKSLFVGEGTPSVLERTQKLFYMCCTRAKENLAVFYHNPNIDVITKAKSWFGEENVLEI